MDVLAARFSTLTDESGRIALLDLTRLQSLLEHDEGLEFVTTLLSPAETQLFASFTYPKRRLEWLGGRLVAKHCLSRLPTAGRMAPTLYCEHSLLPDENGCPHLDMLPNLEPAPAISISHSREYAAALVTTTVTCGIDIQQKTAQLARVQERFASEEELTLLQRISAPLTRLGIIWTAKEAVKKCLLFDQATFMGTISLIEISYAPRGATWTARCQLADTMGSTTSVRIAEFGDYLIACCTAGEKHA